MSSSFDKQTPEMGLLASSTHSSCLVLRYLCPWRNFCFGLSSMASVNLGLASGFFLVTFESTENLILREEAQYKFACDMKWGVVQVRSRYVQVKLPYVIRVLIVCYKWDTPPPPPSFSPFQRRLTLSFQKKHQFRWIQFMLQARAGQTETMCSKLNWIFATWRVICRRIQNVKSSLTSGKMWTSQSSLWRLQGGLTCQQVFTSW